MSFLFLRFIFFCWRADQIYRGQLKSSSTHMGDPEKLMAYDRLSSRSFCFSFLNAAFQMTINIFKNLHMNFKYFNIYNLTCIVRFFLKLIFSYFCNELRIKNNVWGPAPGCSRLSLCLQHWHPIFLKKDNIIKHISIKLSAIMSHYVI